jgi:hypothetical protein
MAGLEMVSSPKRLNPAAAGRQIVGGRGVDIVTKHD